MFETHWTWHSFFFVENVARKRFGIYWRWKRVYVYEHEKNRRRDDGLTRWDSSSVRKRIPNSCRSARRTYWRWVAAWGWAAAARRCTGTAPSALHNLRGRDREREWPTQQQQQQRQQITEPRNRFQSNSEKKIASFFFLRAGISSTNNPIVADRI